MFEDGTSNLDAAEALENGSQYSINRRFSTSSHNYPWQCDRSDLDSIDSSIFKNSLHQSALEKSLSLRSNSKQLVGVEIHSDLHGDRYRTTIDTADLKTLSNSTTLETTPLQRSNSSYSIKEEFESGITIIEIKDKKNSKCNSSVISYDSIYLSSESDKQTVFEDPISKYTRESGENFIDIQIEEFENIVKNIGLDLEESERAESTIDTLYSQVTKTSKPKVIALEPKAAPDTYSKYTDYISKGSLDRLTSNQIQENIVEKKIKKVNSSESFVNTNTDQQYNSLPDADISKILRDSELIDQKLRLSAEESKFKQEQEPEPDYDSISVRGEQVEISKADGPISIESNIQSEKGAPSIELVQPVRLVEQNVTKVYLPDFGIELDYENSIASFESDSDDIYEPPSIVTIGGRKVIVDEVAAKAVQKDHDRDKQSTNSVHEDFENTYSNQKSVVDAKSTVVESKKVPKKEKSKEIRSKQVKEKTASHLTDVTNSPAKPPRIDKKKNEGTIQKAIPVSIKLESSSAKFCDKQFQTFEIIAKQSAVNMPRPQLLQIIDSKRNNVCQVYPRPNTILNKVCMETKIQDDEKVLKEDKESQQEFQEKVDSVRTYWSKILDDDETDKSPIESNKSFDQSSQTTYFTANTSYNPSIGSENDSEFQSFFPTVEIIELDGQKQAALVKTKNFNDADFDHVRYKVMKSDMFQKSMMLNYKKETQFDGLMQYLQDYSFQELLAHNNVVIIEPVRTKVEKITDKPSNMHSSTCKITNGALQRNGSKNLKKHFFYHPIRVNRELHDDELPTPDTVRNVRRLFEGTLRFNKSPKCTDDSKLNRNTENLRKKAIRYLTIDTSYGDNSGIKKWDSASLSSGISSGDLSSPCECGENYSEQKIIYSSEENLCDDEDGEHFVSQDILEKIRECGSTITYYGGKVLDKKANPDQMTKFIMKEIKQQKCNVCQPRRYIKADDKATKNANNDYLGKY